MTRLVGLVIAFVAIMGVVALRPGAVDRAVAVLQTETPTITSTPTTVTSTATVTTSPSVTPTATSTPGPPTVPVIGFPSSACAGSYPHTSATVVFPWSAVANVSVLFLDLSVSDNNFQDGTYATVVLPGNATSYTWPNLQPGAAYFWRVTGLGANGTWVLSDFGRFTPCAPQHLLALSYTCTGGGRATVVFRWAPTSDQSIFQFVDLSLFNNGFAPNTFLGSGPHAGSVQAIVWPGILTNIAHFWRVNAFTIFGWGPSLTGSFVAQCPN